MREKLREAPPGQSCFQQRGRAGRRGRSPGDSERSAAAALGPELLSPAPAGARGQNAQYCKAPHPACRSVLRRGKPALHLVTLSQLRGGLECPGGRFLPSTDQGKAAGKRRWLTGTRLLTASRSQRPGLLLLPVRARGLRRNDRQRREEVYLLHVLQLCSGERGWGWGSAAPALRLKETFASSGAPQDAAELLGGSCSPIPTQRG